jgi:hypothetical protein
MAKAARNRKPVLVPTAGPEAGAETVAKDAVLVMKPEYKPEFSDRRVELAYEVKALAYKLAQLMNEAQALNLDTLFNPYRGPDGQFAVNTQVVVRLLL